MLSTSSNAALRLTRPLLSKTYATAAEVLANQAFEDAKPHEWREALPFEAIPGPKPLPLIGNTWRFLPFGEFGDLDMMRITKSMYEKYGDICCLRGIAGKGSMVMVYDADVIEKVYRNEGAWPIRDAVKVIVDYRTKQRKDLFKTGGLLAEHGEEWQKLRRVANPILMQPKVVKRYVSSVDAVASELVDNMRHFAEGDANGDMPGNFMDELYKFALESVALVAVDRKIGALRRDLERSPPEVRLILDSVRTFLHSVHQLEFSVPFWRLFPTPTWKKFAEASDTLVNIFKGFIDEAEQKATGDGEMSAFQKMLSIDKDMAITMTMDMLQAGVDTTGKTVGATLYFLAKHKEAQAKLRDEVRRLLPDKDSPLTAELLNEAQYLKATIKESTRMAPIAVGNLRTITKDLVLGGYRVPKGTMVNMGHMFISTETDKYFKRPKEFIPDRFLRSTTGELSHKNVHPFAMMPFGFGPRSCIGMRLAQMEGEVAVAKVVRNFYLDWPHPDPTFKMDLLYGISSPLKLRVKPVEN